MAKPNKKPEIMDAEKNLTIVEEKAEIDSVKKVDAISTTTQQKQKGKKDAEKDDKKNNRRKNQNKTPKPNKVKETVSELKKVTWPTFGKVVKQTMVVLGIVIVFTIILFGIDRLLSWLYTLLINA